MGLGGKIAIITGAGRGIGRAIAREYARRDAKVILASRTESQLRETKALIADEDGNAEYVVNWEDDGQEIKANTRRVYPQLGDNLSWKISNEQHYFHPSITWTDIKTRDFAARTTFGGFIFDVKGSSMFPDTNDL